MLYPDTKKLPSFPRLQAYDVVWNTFSGDSESSVFCNCFIMDRKPEVRRENLFDELGVLLPIHQFENRMLQHLSMIDGLVLSCREQMIRVAGADKSGFVMR